MCVHLCNYHPDQARDHFQVHPFKIDPSSRLLLYYYWTLGKGCLLFQLAGGQECILFTVFASFHLALHRAMPMGDAP